MKIPKNMTEDEVLEIIDRVIERFYRKFIFSYFDAEDIKQEARILAIDGLERYDGVRPLEHFMSVHIRNRLCNFKRNNFIRIDKPCLKCPFNAYIKLENKCTKFATFDECHLYKKWADKNESRKNIISPIGLTCTIDDNEETLHSNINPSDQLSHLEIINIIEEKISIENREDWLKLRNGVKISRTQRDKVLEELQIILQENNIDVSQEW